MTDEEIQRHIEIAAKAAAKAAVEEALNTFYAGVGKHVVKKMLMWVGVMALTAYFAYQGGVKLGN